MAHLIIHLQNANGQFDCEKLLNFPSPRSAWVCFSYTNSPGSRQQAVDLANALKQAVANINPDCVPSPRRCPERDVDFMSCGAFGEPNTLKLLVVVSDGASTTLPPAVLTNWVPENDNTLVVFKRDHFAKLPNPYQMQQVSWWQTSINEVVPSLLNKIDLGSDELKIFISYRQIDSRNLAEQLYDALNRLNFQVFLDSFSINEGVNFQRRLKQEMLDKGMIICIETQNYEASPWVEEEINIAKIHKLGCMAVNIDGAKKVDSIRDEFREYFETGTHFVGTSKVLKLKFLEDLVQKIKYQHSLAMFRKREYLRKDIIKELENHSDIDVASINNDEAGFITARHKATGHIYKIWPTARPAALVDYHSSDINNPVPPTGKRIIVGPAFAEPKRARLNTWLAEKSNIHFFDEGDILNLVNHIIV